MAAQSATTPSPPSATAGRALTHDCPIIAVDGSGFVPNTAQTPSDAWLLRSKLIEDYRNAKPRSKARLICEHELRRVRHEVLRA